MQAPERNRLVAEASAGDGDALQRLLILYHAPLLAAVRERIPKCLDPHVDPEDILQEAYARAFRAVSGCTFAGPAAFYAWLERIALNAASDQQKAMRRLKRDPARERLAPDRAPTSFAQFAEQLTAPDSTPSHKIARREAVAAMLTSLARLTDDQRNVIRLRYLEGHCVPDIAAALGKSEPAVHMLCHRGLKALREMMVSITGFLSRL